MRLVYPSPHHIMRNFTLFPFADPNFLNRFPGDPDAPPPPVDLMINTTMTKQKVDYVVNGYEGDFIGFQTDVESVSVNSTLPLLVFGHPDPFGRVFMAASISSSLGERVLASRSLSNPALVTEELPRDLSGVCPDGTGPPDCYEGATWTPNDPLFFMHHGVCVTSPVRFTAPPSSYHTMAAQMIDKVWYDWQRKNPRNKYSYGGGSITALPHYKTFEMFPTGLPPYLGVSALSDLKQTCMITMSHALCSPLSLIASSLVTASGTTLQFGM